MLDFGTFTTRTASPFKTSSTARSWAATRTSSISGAAPAAGRDRRRLAPYIDPRPQTRARTRITGDFPRIGRSPLGSRPAALDVEGGGPDLTSQGKLGWAGGDLRFQMRSPAQ